MISCPCCNQKIKLGQKELNDYEKSRLPMGNQNTRWNTIRWQVVKAAAVHFEVEDWTSKVDSSLTYEENVKLMADHGQFVQKPGGRTVKDLAAKEKAAVRNQ